MSYLESVSWNLLLFLAFVLDLLINLPPEDLPSGPKGLALGEGIPRGPKCSLSGGRNISPEVASRDPLTSTPLSS